jgi:hypothetical protein
MKSKFTLITLIVCIAMISMAIGAFAATKYSLSFDGKKTALDVQVVKGDAYVSAKKLGELLGYKVVVDSKKSTVTITSPAPKLNAGEYQAKDFVLSDIQVSEGIIGWEVTAEVKTLKKISGAVISLAFFDNAGKRVGKATGSVSDLNKGDTVSTTFITSDDLSGWTKVRPQIDMAY